MTFQNEYYSIFIFCFNCGILISFHVRMNYRHVMNFVNFEKEKCHSCQNTIKLIEIEKI